MEKNCISDMGTFQTFLDLSVVGKRFFSMFFQACTQKFIWCVCGGGGRLEKKYERKPNRRMQWCGLGKASWRLSSELSPAFTAQFCSLASWGWGRGEIFWVADRFLKWLVGFRPAGGG